MDIEPKLASLHVDCFLLLGQQIKKQRRQSGVVECTRHKLIPRTVTAAAATVNKKHERTRALRKMQTSRENCSPGLNLHFLHLLLLLLLMLMILNVAVSSKSKSKNM